MSDIIDPPKVTLRLTPSQMATMLVIEAQIQSLQVGANQLGGFLKLEDEANLLVSAANHLIKGLEKFKREWDGKVVIAQPGDLQRAQGP